MSPGGQTGAGKPLSSGQAVLSKPGQTGKPLNRLDGDTPTVIISPDNVNNNKKVNADTRRLNPDKRVLNLDTTTTSAQQWTKNTQVPL